jgi:hypothetical protein
MTFYKWKKKEKNYVERDGKRKKKLRRTRWKKKEKITSNEMVKERKNYFERDGKGELHNPMQVLFVIDEIVSNTIYCVY